MPVPSNISELHQIPAQNSPAGSESATTMDDYLRAHAAFIAQVRDGNKSAIDALTAHQQATDPHVRYAPLASPALTGTPTAPTATAGTNTTQIATTAFVQRALGSIAGGVDAASDSTTFTAADIGKFCTLSLPTAQDATLPLLSTVPDGATILLHNPSGSIKTIQRQGADQISPDGSVITSVTLLQGEVIEFVKQSSVWRAYGTGALKYSAGFRASLTASGYQKLPSGLIIQWGTLPDTRQGWQATATFPIAFPNSCLSAVATPGSSGHQNCYYNSLTFSKTQVSAYVDGASPTSGRYVAIGY